MLLKYFYDSALAHASYLVGCQKTGEACIIDPGRDIKAYLETAKAEDMRITGAADTHIHADYVSGARELAERCGVKLYLSDEGPPEWKYQYAAEYDHQLLKAGDTFSIGKIEMEVLRTPGHTPESISYLLTDRGGGASTPMGLFTGDFVFVGSIGRPDLLEEAAGMVGTAAAGAKDLYQSIQQFRELPDHIQIWPAHGAGSACGKGLGAIPSSTVGYEKLYNPALQFTGEEGFVSYILSEQPEAPTYFALMKRVNKEGPRVLGDSPLPPKIPGKGILDAVVNSQVIDIRSAVKFAQGHIPKSINIPLAYLAAWAGWLADYAHPIYLISRPEDLAEAVRVLNKIGVESIAGYCDPGEPDAQALLTGTYQEKTPSEVAPLVASDKVTLIDVRGEVEWKEQHIPGAKRCFLAHLPKMLEEFEGDCTLVFQCRSGGRSAIAAGLAKAAGVNNVINLKGGIHSWIDEGFAVTALSPDHYGPGDDASIAEGASLSQAIFWDAKCPF